MWGIKKDTEWHKMTQNDAKTDKSWSSGMQSASRSSCSLCVGKRFPSFVSSTDFPWRSVPGGAQTRHSCDDMQRHSTSMKATLMNRWMEMELQEFTMRIYEILCSISGPPKHIKAPHLGFLWMLKSQDARHWRLSTGTPSLGKTSWVPGIGRRTGVYGCTVQQKTYIIHPVTSGCFATAIWSWGSCWSGLVLGGAGCARLAFYAAVIAHPLHCSRISWKFQAFKVARTAIVTKQCPAARQAVGCSTGVLLLMSLEFAEAYLIIMNLSLPTFGTHSIFEHRFSRQYVCSVITLRKTKLKTSSAFNFLKPRLHRLHESAAFGDIDSKGSRGMVFRVFEPGPNCCLTPDGEKRPGYAWKSDKWRSTDDLLMTYNGFINVINMFKRHADGFKEHQSLRWTLLSWVPPHLECSSHWIIVHKRPSQCWKAVCCKVLPCCRMLSEVFLPRLGRSLGRSLPRPWIKWFKCHPKISKGYLHSSTGTISTSFWHLWQVTSMQRRERRKSPSSAGTNNRCFSLRFSLFFSRSQQWHQTDLVGFDRLRQPQRSPLDHLNLDRWKMLKTLGTIHLNWTIVLKNIKLIQIENDWIFEYELTQSKAWIKVRISLRMFEVQMTCAEVH